MSKKRNIDRVLLGIIKIHYEIMIKYNFGIVLEFRRKISEK